MSPFMSFLGRLYYGSTFEVVIENGTSHADYGSVPGSFLADCDAIAGDYSIQRGRIRAIRRSTILSLRFFGDIPEESHQKFRNVFELIREQFKG